MFIFTPVSPTTKRNLTFSNIQEKPLLVKIFASRKPTDNSAFYTRCRWYDGMGEKCCVFYTIGSGERTWGND
jgi:hypothetical protein